MERLKPSLRSPWNRPSDDPLGEYQPSLDVPSHARRMARPRLIGPSPRPVSDPAWKGSSDPRLHRPPIPASAPAPLTERREPAIRPEHQPSSDIPLAGRFHVALHTLPTPRSQTSIPAPAPVLGPPSPSDRTMTLRFSRWHGGMEAARRGMDPLETGRRRVWRLEPGEWRVARPTSAAPARGTAPKLVFCYRGAYTSTQVRPYRATRETEQTR